MPIELFGAALIAGAAALMSRRGGGNNSNSSGSWSYSPQNGDNIFISANYYKGVGTLDIARDIYLNKRFQPATSYKLHGAWVSPNISKARQYGDFVVCLSINAPREYWCHYKDLNNHPSCQGLQGVAFSKAAYRLGYGVIFFASDEVVIVSPHNGQFFTSDAVTIHNVMDRRGNIVLP